MRVTVEKLDRSYIMKLFDASNPNGNVVKTKVVPVNNQVKVALALASMFRRPSPTGRERKEALKDAG